MYLFAEHEGFCGIGTRKYCVSPASRGKGQGGKRQLLEEGKPPSHIYTSESVFVPLMPHY